jgi:glycosyltransferase involved in cell wall biosynthesis
MLPGERAWFDPAHQRHPIFLSREHILAEHLIDVVIPVFNAARTIRVAIASIQNQTISNIRIILVDDGSTDGGPAILREIAAADPRVDIVTQPNRGIVDARNAGLARCRSGFVAWLDADDLASPDRLEAQLQYLASNPECVAVSGATRHVDEDGRFFGIISRCGQPEAADPLWIPAIEPYLMQSFLMVRRSAIEAAGGYRQLIYAEDADLCWRMQEIGRLHNMEAVLGDYRVHAGSVSSRSIVNGRIMALLSQLSAISAVRRRAGRPDLSFPKEMATRLRSATSLAEVYALGCEHLTQGETDHLEIALAAKLMDLTSYRPYELDAHDCQFIQSAMRKHAVRLRPDNRAVLARSRSGTAARLFRQGLVREAAALISPSQYAATAGRVALRAIVSPAAREKLRRLTGRRTNMLLK